MKLSSLALVAWMLLGQIALADDAPNAVPLPPNTRPSTAAQTADEAPRWTPPPSAATSPGATSPSATAGLPSSAPSAAAGLRTSAPATTAAPRAISAPAANPALPGDTSAAVPPPGSTAPLSNSAPAVASPQSAPEYTAQPPQRLPPSDDAKPLPPAVVDNSLDQPDNSEPTSDQPRPLKSVMIHRPPKTAAPVPVEAPVDSSVTPAHYEEPLPAPPARAPAWIPNSGPSTPRTSAPTSVTTSPPISSITETPVDPEKVAAARAAADLLAGSFDIRTEGVTPVTLLEALSQTSESSRTEAIRDYWRLSRAWSDYRWAENELRKLEDVVAVRGSVDSPMLSTARAAAAARVNEAKLGIEVAQDALMRSAHLPIQTGLYRPSDAPLVGPYHTYFTVLFANRQPPGRTLQIDRSLPLRLKAINDRAAAVQSANSAVHYAEEGHAKSDADMRTVLACHEELYRQRRAFLDEVLNYNLDIGEYATTVAPAGTPNEKLVAMLIDTKQQSERTPTATSDPVRDNSAENLRRNSNDGWVPSTMRSVEPAAESQSRSPQARYNTPTPAGQPDPFTSPTVGDRYRNSAR